MDTNTDKEKRFPLGPNADNGIALPAQSLLAPSDDPYDDLSCSSAILEGYCTLRHHRLPPCLLQDLIFGNNLL